MSRKHANRGKSERKNRSNSSRGNRGKGHGSPQEKRSKNASFSRGNGQSGMKESQNMENSSDLHVQSDKGALIAKSTKDYGVYQPNAKKNFTVLFFDTFREAEADLEVIKEKCLKYDQVNVVVRAEGDMNNPKILAVDSKVKLYAGEAWALIHDRRVEENWYDTPH
ncbi:MAG: hypothetical protein R3B45_14895 [Bdellovibrionota bacterium]